MLYSYLNALEGKRRMSPVPDRRFAAGPRVGASGPVAGCVLAGAVARTCRRCLYTWFMVMAPERAVSA